MLVKELAMSNVSSIEIQPGLNYVHNPQHRNRTVLKSQWTIDYAEERMCFSDSYGKSWFVDNTGWGLHFYNNGVEHLGLSHDRKRNLFIAKFIENDSPPYWHGYPADYQMNIHDIPKEEILKKWLTGEIFSPAQIGKIARGKTCRP
jgi:hypothetical protein